MVRRIHLLRHAKSSWDQPGQADRERPLNKRGRRACKLIRSHLEAERIRPGAAIVSPAVRASETYDRIRKGLPKKIATWTENRVYAADSETLLEVLQELPGELDSVLMVGHNPSIQGLAIMLAAEGADLPRLRSKYPTGGLATLAFKGKWLDLSTGSCELEAFVRPKDLA